MKKKLSLLALFVALAMAGAVYASTGAAKSCCGQPCCDPPQSCCD